LKETRYIILRKREDVLLRESGYIIFRGKKRRERREKLRGEERDGKEERGKERERERCVGF
jgi:hypothetical protein